MDEKIEFISYDGKFPNLCRGTLVLKKGNQEYSVKYALVSGGWCYFTDNYENGFFTSGDWSVNASLLPEELAPYVDEIEKLVNDNVPQGCCGGCL